MLRQITRKEDSSILNLSESIELLGRKFETFVWPMIN